MPDYPDNMNLPPWIRWSCGRHFRQSEDPDVSYSPIEEAPEGRRYDRAKGSPWKVKDPSGFFQGGARFRSRNEAEQAAREIREGLAKPKDSDDYRFPRIVGCGCGGGAFQRRWRQTIYCCQCGGLL